MLWAEAFRYPDSGQAVQGLQLSFYVTRSFPCQQRTEGSSKLPSLVQGRASLIQPSEEPTAKFHCRPPEEFFQKPLRKPGNSQKFPRAASSVCSSQNKAVEAQSLPFFPAQADRGKSLSMPSLFASSLSTGEGVAALLCCRKSAHKNHKGKHFHPLLNCHICPAATEMC